MDQAAETDDLITKLELLTECESIDPQEAEVQVDLGFCYNRLRDDANAITHFEAALGLGETLFSNLGLGTTAYRNKDYPTAEKHIWMAHEAHPEHPGPLWCLSDIRRIEKNFDASEALCRKALEFTPTDVESLVRLGITLLQKDRRDDGIAYVLAALEQKPDHKFALKIRSIGKF